MNKKNIYVSILTFFLGIISCYLVICYIPIKDGETTLTKTIKDVTITDNGISESVDKVYDSVVVVSTYSGSKNTSFGSGFIYQTSNKDSYIITNHHVIDGGDNYKVTYTDGEIVTGTLVGSDEYSDIAVIKVDTRDNYSAVSVGKTEELKVGDTTFTIGAPLDNVYSWTVTRGIISGKERLVEISLSNNYSSDYIMNVLQTDAAVNSGNSGGPLCNSNGEVIGVISSKISSTGVEGMGFAIPIETAVEKAEQIINGTESTYPYLGISMLNVSDIKSYGRYYSQYQTSLDNGVMVVDIESDSSASKSDLKSGDVITKINDTKISNIAYLRYELYKHSVGDTITITYNRNGTEKTTKVKLIAKGKTL